MKTYHFVISCFFVVTAVDADNSTSSDAQAQKAPAVSPIGVVKADQPAQPAPSAQPATNVASTAAQPATNAASTAAQPAPVAQPAINAASTAAQPALPAASPIKTDAVAAAVPPPPPSASVKQEAPPPAAPTQPTASVEAAAAAAPVAPAMPPPESLGAKPEVVALAAPPPQSTNVKSEAIVTAPLPAKAVAPDGTVDSSKLVPPVIVKDAAPSLKPAVDASSASPDAGKVSSAPGVVRQEPAPGALSKAGAGISGGVVAKDVTPGAALEASKYEQGVSKYDGPAGQVATAPKTATAPGEVSVVPSATGALLTEEEKKDFSEEFTDSPQDLDELEMLVERAREEDAAADQGDTFGLPHLVVLVGCVLAVCWWLSNSHSDIKSVPVPGMGNVQAFGARGVDKFSMRAGDMWATGDTGSSKPLRPVAEKFQDNFDYL